LIESLLSGLRGGIASSISNQSGIKGKKSKFVMEKIAEKNEQENSVPEGNDKLELKKESKKKESTRLE